MGDAILRFYEELNDFLAPTQRKREFVHAFRQRTSVKDMIESLGVPHTEVDVILVNGESVGFDRIIEDGDRIAVYPVFESFDVTPIVRLRERPLRDVRFIVDAQLGVLARYLRLCGFDTVYRNDWRDEDLVRLAVTERRVILTRDRALLKRSIVTHGYFVRADKPRAQLKEVCERLDLWRRDRALPAMHPVQRSPGGRGQGGSRGRVGADTRRCHSEFTRCGNCRRVY
jgi:uncharacterized protein with PIN domain/sulfur carrier protein ThiS